MKKVISCLVLLSLAVTVAFAASSESMPSVQDVMDAIASDNALFDRSAYEANSEAIFWEETSRDEPLPMGETVWMKTTTRDGEEKYIEMRILEVTRGKDAEKIALNRNKYNDDEFEGPDDEVIVVKLEIKMQSADRSAKLSISDYAFDFVSQTGNVYKTQYYAGFDDSLEMYSGATGSIEFAATIVKDDLPLLLYDDDVWFSLGELLFPLG